MTDWLLLLGALLLALAAAYPWPPPMRDLGTDVPIPFVRGSRAGLPPEVE